MSSLKPISQLVDEATRIEAGDWSVERWEDGTLFVNSPSGEGTGLDEAAFIAMLRQLFEEHF
jgi:hypothetical protein